MRDFSTRWFLAGVLFFLISAGLANSQTTFKKTYQLGVGPLVSCCQNGMSYGFTSVLHDPSITGNVQITFISASAGGLVTATDPNGIAGTTWEIFLGPDVDGCAFPAGRHHAASISLTTYTCSTTNASTQLIFNTNGQFTTIPTGAYYQGGYNFVNQVFKANDLGQFIFATTSASSFPDGLSLQILNWGGDQGAAIQYGQISVTVAGIIE